MAGTKATAVWLVQAFLSLLVGFQVASGSEISDLSAMMTAGGRQRNILHQNRKRGLQPTDLSFFNNTMGYCEQSETNILTLAVLMDTAEENRSIFFEDGDLEGDPIPTIQPFIDLTRDFISDTLLEQFRFPDDQLINEMTKKDEPGSDRLLTSECQDAILDAIQMTTDTWFELMGVGSFGSGFSDSETLSLNMLDRLRNFKPNQALKDEFMNSFSRNLPVFLEEIYEVNTTRTFYKFTDTMIFKYRVLDVRFAMNAELIFYLRRSRSWYQAAAIGQSFPAKFAAFATTWGYDLEFVYDEMNLDPFFTELYSNVTEICSILPPTEMPSMFPSSNQPSDSPTLDPTGLPSVAPTITPASRDELVTAIAVVTNGGPSRDALSDSFEAFRDRWDFRPFCVLEVKDLLGGPGILAPKNLVLDPLATYKIARRDFGQEFYRSDWFDLCGLYDLPLGEPESSSSDLGGRRLEGHTQSGVPDVVWLQESTNVSASAMFFIERLEEAGLRFEMIPADTETLNWIAPFDRSFVPPTSAPVPTPPPPPTAAPVPTTAPTSSPTDSPPTASPTATPTGPPGIITINVTITYRVGPNASVTMPTPEELATLENITIDFYARTMAEGFNGTFIRQMPLEFTDSAATSGWTTVYVADQFFSIRPTTDEVVQVIEEADYESFIINEVTQVGPYFAQVQGLDLVAGASVKNITASPTPGPLGPTTAPAPTMAPPPTSSPSATPAPNPGVLETNISITYIVAGTAMARQGVTEPSEQELAALQNATIDFYAQTMASSFNETFRGQVPLSFSDMSAANGWTTVFVADQVFSAAPTTDEVVAAIENADYESFIINQVTQVGPYFAQTQGISSLIAKAVVKGTTAPSTAPGPTSAPSAPPVPPPSTAPVISPTSAPSAPPVPPPSTAPVISPTSAPSAPPVPPPSTAPVISPTSVPSEPPVPPPSTAPVISPTSVPSAPPVPPPSTAPVISPTSVPSAPPVPPPSTAPVISPTSAPSSPPVPPPSAPPVPPPTSPPLACEVCDDEAIRFGEPKAAEPWFVLLPGCGGSLVHGDIVLTAAHCIIAEDAPVESWPDVVEIAPSTRNDGTPFGVDIGASVLHPDWLCDNSGCPGGQVGENVDLAILKLTDFSDNEVICLNDDNRPMNGARIDIMGFGRDENEQSPFVFQGATVTAFNDCGQVAPDNYFCMIGDPVEDEALTCPGDSGGPVNLAGCNVQLGLVSFGLVPPDGAAFPCATAVASGFQRVDGVFNDWIQEQICNLSSQPPESCATNSPDPEGFQIAVDYVGASTAEQAIIQQAKERMESIIIGDVPGVDLTGGPATPCGASPLYVDDFYCCVRVRDLPQNILGVGGVRLVRTDMEGVLLPISGEMSIDRDSHSGRSDMLMDTVEHEFLHAVGFGILFDVEPYELAGPGGNQCSYSPDSEAGSLFAELSGCSSMRIPMTKTCGHWSHDCFSTNELMGPYGGDALSELTIAGLQDLGYVVDRSKGDPLTGDDLKPECRCDRRSLRQQQEQPPVERRLDANEAFAIEYGQAIMDGRAMENAQNLFPIPGVMDMGTEVVSVVYLDEEGMRRSVIVKNARR